MAVDAVIAGVERAVFVPFNGYIPREIGVFDFGGFFKPIEALCLHGPEDIGLVDRAVIHCIILRFGDVDVFEDIFGWGVGFYHGSARVFMITRRLSHKGKNLQRMMKRYN